MKVLITGGCGFLGSHIADYFHAAGHQVVCVDNLATLELSRAGYDIAMAHDITLKHFKTLGIELVRGDVRDKETIFRLSRDCDFIIHTAAQPAVTIGFEEPELDFHTNAIGALNVLMAAREFGIPVALCSTIHIYGNSDINKNLIEHETRFEHPLVSFDEQHPILQGRITPLHVSKRAAELLAETFISSYAVRAGIFRLSGLFGTRQIGGMDHGWVANFSIRALMEREITVFGTGKQVRDILHARDVARAMQCFFLRGESGTYNLGGGMKNSISLQECLAQIEHVVGKPLNVRMAPVREADLHYFVCNIEKVRKVLQWEPEISLEQGLPEIIDWLREHKAIFAVNR